MILPGRDVPFRLFLRTLIREIGEDDLADYGAAVAFSAFLAIFPFLVFVVALASLVVDPSTLDVIMKQIDRVAPEQVADILGERLQALTTGTKPGLLTVSAVGAIWAASGAVAALTSALNSANDIRDRRPFWKTRGLALLVTVAAAALVIVASAIAIAAPAVAAHLGGAAQIFILILRWPVAAGLMLVVIACLYHFLPDTDQPFALITPGSVVAVAGWIAASLAFSLYVSHFGKYEVVYGALGSVIVLLLWMWISALVILVGAEINAVLSQLAARTAPAKVDVPR